MNPIIVTLWISTVLLGTIGQLAFKGAAIDTSLGDGFARWRKLAIRPRLWIGIGCFAGEFLCWLAFLSLVPLSRGVLLGSINIVVIMLAGRLLFREQLSRWRVLGIVLIGAGVSIVGLG